MDTITHSCKLPLTPVYPAELVKMVDPKVYFKISHFITIESEVLDCISAFFNLKERVQSTIYKSKKKRTFSLYEFRFG